MRENCSDEMKFLPLNLQIEEFLKRVHVCCKINKIKKEENRTKQRHFAECKKGKEIVNCAMNKCDLFCL